MGASFDSRTVSVEQVPSATELKKWFNALQEDDLYENGHSYSGTIGMAHGLKVIAKTFESFDEAEDFVDRKAEKWGPALAVKVEDKASGKTYWFVGAVCSS